MVASDGQKLSNLIHNAYAMGKVKMLVHAMFMPVVMGGLCGGTRLGLEIHDYDERSNAEDLSAPSKQQEELIDVGLRAESSSPDASDHSDSGSHLAASY